MAIVGGIYAVYVSFSHTEEIQIGQRRDDIKRADPADPNRTGRIGDTGVGAIERARFTDIDRQTGRLLREFGFEEVAYAQENKWHIDEPYITLYEDDFTCYVTSDTGSLQLEEGTGQPSPDELVLQGRVVINVVPAGVAAVDGNFIFLNELLFESEKSKFSSKGPVKFVSPNAILNGTGMELIYNQNTEVLEYFRIEDMHSLRLKSDGDLGDISSNSQAEQPDVASGDEQISRTETVAESLQANGSNNNGIVYLGGLESNVRIETQDQVALAERLLVRDIIFSGRDDNRPEDNDQPAHEHTDDIAGDEPEDEWAVELVEEEDTAELPVERADIWQDPAVIESDFGDIVVTCDGGLTVLPEEDSDELWRFTSTGDNSEELWRAFEREDPSRAVFAASMLEYGVGSDKVVASGANRLKFNMPDEEQLTGPVTMTSSNSATFDMDANLAVFDGDAVCLIPQPNGDDYQLSCNRLVVNLAGSRQDELAISEITAQDDVTLEFYLRDESDEDTDTAQKVTVTSQTAVFKPDQHRAIFEGDSLCRMPQPGLESHEATLRAERITVEMPDGDAGRDTVDMVAAGPANLNFYISDQADDGDEYAIYPVDVSAQEHIRYDGAAARLVFVGQCRAKSVRDQAGIETEHSLSSQEIQVQLATEQESRQSVEYMIAKGGVVELSQARRRNSQLLGFVKLTCTKFDYDVAGQQFTASGPGDITVDNSQAEDDESAERFALSRRCYAAVRQFDRLNYSMAENRIIAQGSNEQPLDIRYIPVSDQGHGQQTVLTARTAEALLGEDDRGRAALKWLTASGGITYEEPQHYFAGNKLLYNADEQTVKVDGSDQQPCLLNGVRVDGIEYDLITGNIRARVPSPGWLSITE